MLTVPLFHLLTLSVHDLKSGRGSKWNFTSAVYPCFSQISAIRFQNVLTTPSWVNFVYLVVLSSNFQPPLSIQYSRIKTYEYSIKKNTFAVKQLFTHYLVECTRLSLTSSRSLMIFSSPSYFLRQKLVTLKVYVSYLLHVTLILHTF